jgi:hypothetical protein
MKKSPVSKALVANHYPSIVVALGTDDLDIRRDGLEQGERFEVVAKFDRVTRVDDRCCDISSSTV